MKPRVNNLPVNAATQQQTTAGDQWSFFQAKRQRGASQRNSLDLLQHLAEVRPLTAAALNRVAEPAPTEADQPDAAKARAALQVRRCNLSAERHHKRSQRFFYGTLAAQFGVIVSTFAMAARKRNMLWVIAAAAGLLAIAFAVYVYLCV